MPKAWARRTECESVHPSVQGHGFRAEGLGETSRGARTRLLFQLRQGPTTAGSVLICNKNDIFVCFGARS